MTYVISEDDWSMKYLYGVMTDDDGWSIVTHRQVALRWAKRIHGYVVRNLNDSETASWDAATFDRAGELIADYRQ